MIAEASGVYATDPNYSHLATPIARQDNVTQAIEDVRQEGMPN